jgi:hypothetical protein
MRESGCTVFGDSCSDGIWASYASIATASRNRTSAEGSAAAASSRGSLMRLCSVARSCSYAFVHADAVLCEIVANGFLHHRLHREFGMRNLDRPERGARLHR